MATAHPPSGRGKKQHEATSRRKGGRRDKDDVPEGYIQDKDN